MASGLHLNLIEMKHPVKHFCDRAWPVLLLLLAVTAGCQKKCQQNTETLRTFVDQEFRLVQSTDPETRKDLTNTNFLIMVFKIDYYGELYRVENNSKFNDPVLLLRYNPDPENKLIQVQFYEPPSETSVGPDPSLGKESGPLRTYRYSLSNELNLVESGTGYRYRYVPFTGVVKPDEICRF